MCWAGAITAGRLLAATYAAVRDLVIWMVRRCGSSARLPERPPCGHSMRTALGDGPRPRPALHRRLSLLVGTIFVFDLRLLGIGRRIPDRRLHRLIPWGLAGYFLTLATGMLFLLAEPDRSCLQPRVSLRGAVHGAGGPERLALLSDVVPAGLFLPVATHRAWRNSSRPHRSCCGCR